MSRTFRREGERHEYSWVLHDWNGQMSPQSKAGRRALARFHSDKCVTMGGSPPRSFRKVSDRQLRTRNNRMLRRWINDPQFDPVFQPWHLHAAKWMWW